MKSTISDVFKSEAFIRHTEKMTSVCETRRQPTHDVILTSVCCLGTCNSAVYKQHNFTCNILRRFVCTRIKRIRTFTALEQLTNQLNSALPRFNCLLLCPQLQRNQLKTQNVKAGADFSDFSGSKQLMFSRELPSGNFRRRL